MINADDMQSWAYLLAPTFQFVNTAGKPLTEGWIEVYIAGTRDKYYCASDFNGTLHPFQIPLDSLGANIVLADPDQAYDVYVYNKYGSLVMSRYHVSPGMAGGSGVLNITITSEDGTVSVNNDGNGNFDLSIQDTVDRVEALELAVSGINAEASIGYAIAHSYINNQDGTFNLIEDGVSGIDFTPNMDGFRLKSGHVYQFNFNAKFDLGENDRNCSGKFYLEGPDTIAQDWLFDLDDSYNHSESFNGATVLVTPKDLNFYDIKLKYQWDSAYSYPPDIDLNKISIVDVTSILSTTVSGIGGDYTGGDGIYINDETNVISVDMDYINSHLNIDATEIIASAVNIATAYTDARVTSASGDLVNLIAEVSASIPTAISQVQSDWTETNTSSPAYIQHKPDLSVYATNDSLTAVSSVLQTEIDSISGTIPEQVNADWDAVSGKAEILNKPDLSIYATHDELIDAVTAVSSMIPTDYVTHSEVSAVSANLVNYVNSVSGDITNYVDESIVSAINVATGACEQVQSDWTEDDITDPAYIKNKPNEIEIIAGQNIGIFSDATTITIAASGSDLSDYATHSEVSAVSAYIISQIPDTSDFATVSAVSAVSSTLNNSIANKKDKQTSYIEEGNTTQTITKITQNANGEIHVTYGNISYPQQTPSVEMVSPSGTLTISSTTVGNTKTFSVDVAHNSGFEYGQFYSTAVSGAATMAKAKGNIDVTNDGKIILKQGQSYHVTVRGRYNQSTPSDDYGVASYIEYITNNSINISVDKSRTDSQFFELSYDLYKLNSDTNYYVFFTLNNAVINDLFIDIHSITGGGSGSGGGGSSPEYDAGYGIQILNNVISVSGIAPQIQSDWTQTNTSSVDYIKNKPEEAGLIAGEGVSITASGSDYIISAVVTASPVLTGYVTESELQTVSGNIVSQIPDISGLATEAELQIVSASIPDVSNLATKNEVQTVSNDVQTVSAAIPDVSIYATHSEVNTVSGTIVSMIPSVSSLATKAEVSTATGILQAEIDAISAVTGGTTYTAGDYIGIVDDTISVTGITDLVAGNAITITASGNSAIISSTGETQVQSDWNVTDSTSKAYIKNKPRIPAAQIQSNWNQTNTSAKDYIKNKPTIHTYTGGEGIDITNDTVSLDNPLGLYAGDNVTIEVSGTSAIISAQVSGGSSTTLSGASGVIVDNDTVSLDEPLFIQAGSGIEFTQTNDTITVSSTITLQSLNDAGVVNIQIVNAPSACTGANILYLIPEA